MENVKQNELHDERKTKRFEKRLKSRLELENSSLLGDESDLSLLFEINNSISPEFSIIALKFERATLREASSFKKIMEETIANDERNIIVDLNNCEFVDSSFFGVLVAGVKRLKTMKKKFYFVYDSRNKLPIFSATGLDKVFKVFPSIDEAIVS